MTNTRKTHRLLQQGLGVAVGLLVACVAFLAVEFSAHLLFAREDLLGGPARVVLAVALVVGVLAAWLLATKLSQCLRGLSNDARFVVLLFLLLYGAIAGDLVLSFIRDPDQFLRTSDG